MSSDAAANSRPILIVDDDPASRAWLAEALKDAGYETLCASNGRQALRRIAEHGAPQLVLLDMLMPEMNGYQLLEVLGCDPDLLTIPVVVLSAFGPTATLPALGISAWLSKPVELDRLFDAIERAGS